MSLQACTAATFAPSVFGTQILAIEANVLTNHSITNPFHAISVGGLDFCNITVTYTHPGQNDRIDVETWLPTNGWNKRLLAPGGGGFGAGRGFGVFGMATAVKAGFASVQTNAGIAQNPVPQNPEQMESLALLSPGNLNFYNLQNLASVSLKDEALMAKSHAKDFYGEAPEYSYWNGCSQGGRQGLMLAQRFPELYDGIVAAAPAQSWTKLFGNMLWPQQVMNREGYVPSPCELDAITNATIALCDGYDGVIDGIVSNPKACRSDADPAQFVGKQVDCSAYGQDSLVITSQAANIYAAYLDGLKTAEGKQVYPGLEPGSDPTGSFTAKMLSILVTECSENGKCVGKPNNLGITWLKYMVAKDPELDMQNLTDEEFRNLVYSGTQHYASIIGTEGTDLTKFRNRGGKMITWHGLADNIIAPMASENYYNNVTAVMPDIADFYRFYEVPGLGHCSGGPTKPPGKLLEQLMQWVEKGTVPEESPVTAIASDGTVQNRIICPYPKTAKLTACKDASLQECWTCDADPETLPKGIKGASPSAGHTLREEL